MSQQLILQNIQQQLKTLLHQNSHMAGISSLDKPGHNAPGFPKQAAHHATRRRKKFLFTQNKPNL